MISSRSMSNQDSVETSDSLVDVVGQIRADMSMEMN